MVDAGCIASPASPAGTASPSTPTGGGSSPLRLRVKRLSEKAMLPTRMTPGSAGYDLYAAVRQEMAPGTRAMVSTDISVEIPAGHYGRIAPRSGLAVKKGIGIGAGVIDSDFRGPIGVVMFNHNDEWFEMMPGDRIAQLILEKISTPAVEEITEHTATQRGEGGFGSTGGFSDATTAAEMEADVADKSQAPAIA